MERPTLEYAENCTLIHTYARKLEEYCDELEAIVSKGDCITHYEKEIQRLEKTQIEWVGRVLQVDWEFIL